MAPKQTAHFIIGSPAVVEIDDENETASLTFVVEKGIGQPGDHLCIEVTRDALETLFQRIELAREQKPAPAAPWLGKNES